MPTLHHLHQKKCLCKKLGVKEQGGCLLKRDFFWGAYGSYLQTPQSITARSRMMNVTSNPPLKIHAHGDMVPFRVLCAIKT